MFLLKGLWETLFPRPHQLVEAATLFDLWPPPSICKANENESSFSHTESHWLPLLPSPIYKDPCDYIGPVYIIKESESVKSLRCAQLFLGLQAARLLCPWDSPGKNTGVGCCFLLQGIFPTQGSNLHLWCLLLCRLILYPLSHRRSQRKSAY